MTTENKSPKIVIRRELEGRKTPDRGGKRTSAQVLLSPSETGRGPVNLRPFYWECFTHSLIIVYGVVILVFTFYNPLN